MTPRSELFEFKATALADDDAWHEDDTDFTTFDGDQLDREERAALRRVAGPVHRARGRHRGRVPPAAPGAGRAGRRLDRGHRRRTPRTRMRRARRAGRDGRLRRCSTASDPAPRRARPGDLHRLAARSTSCATSSSPTGADTVICDGELAPEPAAQPRGRRQGQGRRPHRADPRHLRPARQEPGGQGAGRAGPAAVPAAAAARLG